MRILIYLFATFLLISSNASAQAACTSAQRDLAAGVRYEQLCRTTPQGEPLSIHVLRVPRKGKARIHAVAGHNEAGQMARELPTAMAQRDLDRGHHVIAVVNGDFDFIKPESNMGISVGLSVIEGRLWTGDQSQRPVLAFTRDNEPRIGIPRLTIEARTGNKEINIAAFNKPYTPDTAAIFTSQFRSEVQLTASASALLARGAAFDHSLYKNFKARIENPVVGDITPFKLPANTIALIPSPFISGDKKLKLRLDATVDGHRIRDAIGGLPIIVRDGHATSEARALTGNLSKRHPRTAVCYNRNSVIFTVIDGRQPSLSVGMTLTELAALMIDLGCEVAMNTDGGGSSVMAITQGTNLYIVNSPSDGRERGRGNAWVIEAR